MRPIPFSTYFDIDPAEFDKAGLLDPYINTDTPLFIDPLLIDKSANSVLATDGIQEFRTHFGNLVRLLTLVEQEGDPAWLGAERLLSLSEPAENGLGYSRRARAGASRPREIRVQLLRTVRKILRLGSKDPEMLSLMAFLEPGVGSDTISDFTTKAMTEALARITHDFCRSRGVDMQANPLSEITLPTVLRGGKDRPFVLIPRDVLRDLPVTDSWQDVWEATAHNQALRDRVSVMLAGIAEPTIKEQKEAIKRSVTQSKDVFEEFLNVVKSAATSYDQNEDAMGYYAFRRVLADYPLIRTDKRYDVSRGPEEIHQIILDALGIFKHHVEDGNLWEELWASNQPKRERASQLLFFAIADAYCRAHNVDISGEPNMGGGPVDFKFSQGYYSRVVVELKKSTGSVEHGYRSQLERYKKAAETDYGIFAVIDYGRGGHKIRTIERLKNQLLEQGQRASEIVVINARKKVSASKDRSGLI
jgi:hypothetical protein